MQCLLKKHTKMRQDLGIQITNKNDLFIKQQQKKGHSNFKHLGTFAIRI